MPPTNEIVKLIRCLWFSLGLLAGRVLFFDRFLVPFIPISNFLYYFTPYISSHLFMLTSIKLPLFGLLSLNNTFCTPIAHIHNKFLLNLFTILKVFLQITFIDLILPKNPKFYRKYFFQNIYPLWQSS